MQSTSAMRRFAAETFDRPEHGAVVVEGIRFLHCRQEQQIPPLRKIHVQ
jgi:hypothetical protein